MERVAGTLRRAGMPPPGMPLPGSGHGNIILSRPPGAGVGQGDVTNRDIRAEFFS